jgi:outer membrane protein OmpA-like peptidoglycan-associated protein
MIRVQKQVWGGVALSAALALSGCATKGYVNETVGSSEAKVGERVGGVETQVEEAQMKLRQHDQKLADHDNQIQASSKTAQQALERAVAAGKLAEGKLLYETVLSDDKVKFGFDQAELSKEAKAALDEFAAKLKAENKGVYLEIQGHTDNIGGDAYNEALGLQRAQAVRYYLNKTGGLPLHKMEAISYGESEPVEDNKTRDGRNKNRRVVLVVLQ